MLTCLIQGISGRWSKGNFWHILIRRKVICLPLRTVFRRSGNCNIVLLAENLHTPFQIICRNTAHSHPAKFWNIAVCQEDVQLHGGHPRVGAVHLKEVAPLEKDDISRVCPLDFLIACKVGLGVCHENVVLFCVLRRNGYRGFFRRSFQRPALHDLPIFRREKSVLLNQFLNSLTDLGPLHFYRRIRLCNTAVGKRQFL